jgi:hypothetical protein
MEDVEKYIIDEAIEEQETTGNFIIDNDEKAEWALKKIAVERQDCARIKAVCERMIEQYQRKIDDEEARLERKTSYLIGQLSMYINTVQTKDSKTQKTYALPSGKLKIKFQKPEFVRDDEKLLNWLKENASSYVKTKESPDWGEFKKTLSVSGDKVVDASGEIVDGITVVEREPVFDVEI